MDKAAIKKFAVWARNKLIKDISYKAGLMGITEDGIAEKLPQSATDAEFYDIGLKQPHVISGEAIQQRNCLADLIQQTMAGSDYQVAYYSVIEEVAYTWFNRLIAVRFMEVNDYLPSHIRVLSSDNAAKLEPDIVTTPFDAGLSFTQTEQEKILCLKNDNKVDALFRLLFIKQCNALHSLLPNLFEKTEDYSELLLNVSVTDPDGVVYHLVHDINEDDFNVAKGGQVEIIGWLYQYYNDERKNEVINIYKGTVKKEDIPAATQLFTTDWVVRYIVDNSLGRYWIERHPNSHLKDKLQYLVIPKDQSICYIDDKIIPENLLILDPCMGSGHFLIYTFEVLIKIYEECGYSAKDAAKVILEHNLYGLDIDDRAFQLAYFAVMMKARQYNRRILNENVVCHVYSIQESNVINRNQWEFFGTRLNDSERNVAIEQMNKLLDIFIDAKEYGSLLSIEDDYNWNLLRKFAVVDNEKDQMQLDFMGLKPMQEQLQKIIDIGQAMAQKYEIVVTNPPYLNKMDVKLKDFVNDQYKKYSGDLFSAFIYRNLNFCKYNGYSGFMTPFVWMFIKTYEKLREFIIQNKSITTLVQMEYSAFEEATVPICTFVLKNGKSNDKGLYIKLSNFKGGMDVQREKVLEAITNKNCNYFFESLQSNFSKIPGSPIAYWVSKNVLSAYDYGKQLGKLAFPKTGMTTGDNNRFLRLWPEIKFIKISLNSKDMNDSVLSKKNGFLIVKGGDLRGGMDTTNIL